MLDHTSNKLFLTQVTQRCPLSLCLLICHSGQGLGNCVWKEKVWHILRTMGDIHFDAKISLLGTVLKEVMGHSDEVLCAVVFAACCGDDLKSAWQSDMRKARAKVSSVNQWTAQWPS